MKCFAVLLFITYVSASALPYDLEDAEQHEVVPLSRFRRQSETNWKIQSPGIGTVSHTGTILNNNNHRLDGTGYVSKDLRGHGIRPDAYGGSLDYSHKPSGSVFGVGADHVRRGGTDLKASGTYNFVHTKNADVGITGEYGRHFGAGGGKPNYGVFLGGKIRF